MSADRYAWMDAALCAQADEWTEQLAGGDSHAAKKICNRCPVRLACAAHAATLETHDGGPIHGIWGGLSQCDGCGRTRPRVAYGWCGACYRRWTRHGRPQGGPPPPTPLQPCGTDAGYQRHLKHGEQACQPCRDARNAAQRKRRTKWHTMRRTMAPPEPTGRDQWTAEQTRTAYTIALATADSPSDRRLLLEALGLAPPSATNATPAHQPDATAA